MTGEHERYDDEILLEALREVDRLMPDLADEEPPPELVARTLDAVAAQERTEAEPPKAEAKPETAKPGRRRGFGAGGAIAAAALLVLAVSVTFAMQTGGKIKGLFETADAEIDTVYEESPLASRRSRFELPKLGGQGQQQPAASPMSPSRVAAPESVEIAGGDFDFVDSGLDDGPSREAYGVVDDNPWVRVADQPRSTFSIDVDTASYANVRRFLREGRLPPKDAVRIEELLNYFPYDYPSPGPDADAPFEVITEVGPAPWAPAHRLVHVGLQAPPIADDELPVRNLVFLLDVSGSMNNPDKLPLLKQAMGLVVESLRPQDRVAIVVYAGAAGVVLEPTSGANQPAILEAMERLEAGGSTHGADGIVRAYELARRSFVDEGVNRVILATDGDFNVGVSSEGELVRLIERERESGVFLTVLGFGTGNLQDDRMESLADKGNGNYAYIDSLDEARKVLVEQAGGTMVTVAKDVKIQVEFNPLQVEGYRLIGYANRVMANRDFADDRKDAGEIGAGHSVTALYEVVPVGGVVPAPGADPLRYQRPKVPTKAARTGELLTVRLRWKQPRGITSKLAEFPVVDGEARLEATSADFRFSAAVAAWGMILRRSEHVGSFGLSAVEGLAGASLGEDVGGYRREFLGLVDRSGRISLPQ
jgi:Ca-activated chloride channel homolog